MGALEGLTVIDVSEIFQGPLAAQILGDFGANVIKIERPGRGALERPLDRYGTARGLMSCYYTAGNRNKRSITLNLKKPGARQTLLRLVETADVLVHSYRPGAMEKFGFGYEDLAKINSRLIYATTNGFGGSGPMAHKGGQDMVAQTLSGLAMLGADADGKPLLYPPPSIDFCSGMILAQGIMMALYERERSGLGQKVSTCLLNTAIATQGLEISSLTMHSYETHWVDEGLHFVFKTTDGYVTALGFFRENPLQLMCAAMEIEDLTQRSEYANIELQVQKKKELDDILQAECIKYTTTECLRRFESEDVICAKPHTLAEALENEQVLHNEMVAEVPVPGMGTQKIAANPLRLSRTPYAIKRGPAELGEHTLEVLEEFGFSREEIENLEDAGVFGGKLDGTDAG
ncbi:MAG TPA: CaiB/BaiF CoA-transferase family protein [Rhodospirillales bacterium]|nr:CaiB/BaiF CoA-transferase family protein [Rhodospirillales bacterium]